MVNTTRDPRASSSPGAWRWAVLGLSALLFVCSQFFRVANAVIAPELQHDLGLSSEALGALSAAFFYGFAAAQVPLAIVLDRLGARWSMAALSLVGAAGAVVFATAEQRADATLGRVLLGIGMAGNLMGALKLIGHWFSAREFATISGVLLAVGTAGNMLATTPLALLVGAMGWRRSFELIAAVTAALAILFWALVRERPGAPGGAASGTARLPVAEKVARLLGSRDYWLISFGAFCRYGAFLAIQGLWAGPYLVEVAGLSTIQASQLILLLNVAFVAGAPLGGWLSDRVLSSRKRVMLLALGGIVAAEFAFAASGRGWSTWLIAATLVVLGVAASFGQVAFAHIKEIMPPEMSGMAMTGVNFFNMLGAAAFVHAMGWVLERWSGVAGVRGVDGYRTAFLLGAAVVAVALGLYLLTGECRLGSQAGWSAEGEDPARSREIG